MKNCNFCKIIRGDLPGNIVYEDEYVLAILDADPISNGHSLVIPKKDIRDIYDLDEITAGKVFIVAKKIAKSIKKNFNFDGIMTMQVNDKFQDIPHFHLHVFGRNQDNDIKIKYPNNSTNIPLNQIAQKIKESIL